MAELVALSSSKHKKLKVSSNASLTLAAKQHVLQIQASEIGKAVSSFPVLLNRNATTGDWALSVITSLAQGHNLFVEKDRWTATYLPNCMQTWPLYLMRSSEDEKGYRVGIDQGSSAFSEDQGEALFDDQGKESLYLTRLTAMLEAGIKDNVQTRLFLKTLDDLGLFKSIDIQVHFDNQAVQTIKGLHTLDEDKLQSLTAQELEELHKKGYLLLIHAMLISIFQLNLLIKKHNQTGLFANVKQITLAVARDGAAAQ